MKAHVQEVLAGGGSNTYPLYGSVSYYQDEERLFKVFKIKSTYEPKNVCEIEQKLYDFLEKEKINYHLSHKAQCELFVIGHKGYICILFAPDAEYRESQVDRLCSLAHEIGHYFDFKHNYKFNLKSFDSKDNYKFKIKKEIVAWKYAFDILSALGFNKWEEFFKIMKESLMTYINDGEEVERNVSAIRNS